MNEKPSTFLKIGQVSKTLGVSIDTLRRWEKSGKIKTIRTPGGTRLYSLESLKKINPSAVQALETHQTQSLSTEELLKRADSSVIPAKAGIHREATSSAYTNSDSWIPDQVGDDNNHWTSNLDFSDVARKKLPFLSIKTFSILSGLILTVSGGLIARSYLAAPSTNPPFQLPQSQVLATLTGPKFVEINSDSQINGKLAVRDSINDLTIESSPSASTFTLTSGGTTLSLTKTANLDQDVSTTGTPSFSSLDLTATKNQIVFQSGAAGRAGTLTWTPTAVRVITLPDATTTLVGTDTTQTLTNKSLSGSSNTFTNIPNSAFSNASITINPGTNLSGGGAVSLGGSVAIALKDSISLSGTLTVSGTTTLNGVAYTWPSSQGSSGTALTDDGSGALTWSSLSSAGGWSDDGTVVRLTTSTDNVGIGTTSPNFKLDVTGNAGVGGSLTVTSEGIFGSILDNGSFVVNGTSFLQAINASSLTTSGNVGVGGSITGFGALSGLNVSRLTNLAGLNATSINSSTLTTAGNVGIGSSLTVNNLSYDLGGLRVNGFSDLTGNVGIGGSLTVNSISMLDSLQVTKSIAGAALGISGASSLNTLGVSSTTTLNSTVSLTGLSLGTGNGICLNSSNNLVTCTVGSGGISGSGFSGGVSFFNSSSNITASPNLYWDNSNSRLGIGTSAPSQEFQVNTGASSTVITSSGNVGIGTTSPSAALHVVGNTILGGSSSDLVTFNASLASGTSIIPAVNGGSDLGSSTLKFNNIWVNNINSSSASSFSGQTTFTYQPTTTAINQSSVWINPTSIPVANVSLLGISVGGVEKARLSSNGYLGLAGANDPGANYIINAGTIFNVGVGGNVGIGTSLPQAKLVVQGNVGIGYTGLNQSIPINGLAVSGNVGIGTTTANSTLSVAGNEHIGGIYQGISAPANGLFVDGNVGIGATTSSNKLDVWGNAAITGNLTIGGSETASSISNGQFLAGNGLASAPSYSFTSSTSTGLWSPLANSLALTTNGGATSGINITSLGNVGIGASTANSALTVNGGVSIGSSNITAPTNGLFVLGNVGIGATSPNTSLSVAGNVNIGWTGTNASVLGTGLGLSVFGNIGIGVTTANSKLAIAGNEVLGTGYAGMVGPANGLLVQGLVGIGTTAPGNTLAVNGGLNLGTFASSTGPSNGLAVSGNVGIGGTTANSTLSVAGNEHIGSLRQGISAPTNGLFVDGNVGIGATTSNNLLDVWGNARITGTLTLDQTLTIGGSLTVNGSQILAPDGTASLPGYSFSADTDTGLWRSGTNLLALTTNGSGTLQSGTTINGLSVDANGNVGIGTTNPNNTIQVANLINFDNTNSGTYLGYQAGINNSGNNVNTFVGYQAGKANTTGSNNSALGYTALQNNTTGNYNSAMGVNALNSNTTGSNNSAMGYGALNSNTTGIQNSAMGYEALFSNTTGIQNSAMGYAALAFNTTGSYNSAMGYEALFHNSTGSANSAFGYQAIQNVGVGTSNSAFGYQAGNSLTSGSSDTLLGGFAGQSLTTGSGNIVIGYNADALGATVSNNLNIGNLIFGTGIGTGTAMASGNVGIGASIPNASLTIQGNVGIGYTGSNQVIPANGLAVSGNVGIGTTTANSTLSVAGNEHIGGIYQGIAAPTNGLFVDGNVGIGATTSSNKLDVWGNARITGTLTVDQTSTFGGNFTLSSGQFLAPNGTSSLPSYSFTNSTSTGIYSPSANALALQTNGASIPPLTITAGGNVGIGTTAPTKRLETAGSSAAYSTIANIGLSDTRGLAADRNWALYNANSADGNLDFKVSTAAGGNTDSGNIVMSINSSGTVGINTTPAASYYLSVAGTSTKNPALFTAPNTSNNSFGPVIEAGTTSSDYALYVVNAANNTAFFKVFGDGGVNVGVPTGGDKGGGSINAVTVYRNGTALDFVFEPGYQLMSIPEMASFFKTNNHLPTIETRLVNNDGTTNEGALADHLWETAEVHALYISQLDTRLTALETSVENVSNQVTSQSATASSDESIEAGDLVSAGENQGISKSEGSYDQKMIGIVSTKPGLKLSSDEASSGARPVALSGRVPVKVSSENGSISVGDYLTSSSVPGVAMKATRPGPTVGKALESYDNPDPTVVGKILAFVNVSYADPGNFFSSLSMDSDGNLIIPKIKTASITLDSSVASASAQLSSGNGQIALNPDPNYTNPGPSAQSSSTTYYDLTGKIASLEDRIKESETRIKNLEEIAGVATPSGQLAEASSSASASSSATPSASLAQTQPVQSATSSANLADIQSKLTPPETLFASGSATLANLSVTSEASVSGMLTAYGAAIQDNFKVLGVSTLGKTNVAGDLSVDGTLSIENGSELNVIGTLFLQKSPLATNLDIFNGKVTVDSSGNIKTSGKFTATEVQTNRLTISNSPVASASATLGTSIGTGTIPANNSKVTIQTKEASDTSKIFITPTTATDKVLSVTNIKKGESFDVSILNTTPVDINFNWWIVQTN